MTQPPAGPSQDTPDAASTLPTVPPTVASASTATELAVSAVAAAPALPGEPHETPAASHRHQFANAEFDEAEGILRVKGQAVDVEPRPLRLLVELLRRPNEVVTKDELFDSVWNGRVTVDHVLANAVSKLRSALGEEAGARIVTVPRVGYRLNGPVQRVASVPVSKTLTAGSPVPGREAFLLERALGEASRSEVWLARHARLGHVQVFKFASDAAGLSALKREFTLYRVLQKELGPRDDFARVTETQFMSAPYFIEAEYAGVSLLEWADQEGHLVDMALPDRLALFLQVARAVAAAHSVGVLHKDLKPGNVLVAGGLGNWQVRLTDFGSGRLLQPERLAELKLTALGMTQAQASNDGSHSGTFMYLAPELLGGHSPTVQSDVYSLGVMLFQLVVGDLRQPLATGWQRSVDDELLVEEIAHATEGAHERRTASASALVEHLTHLERRRQVRQQHQADAAKGQSAIADAQRRRARRPWLAAAFGGVSLGLLASVALYVQADRARLHAQDMQVQVQSVSDFLHQDVMESPDVLVSGAVQPLQLLDVMRRASTTAAERFKGQPIAEARVRRKIAETYLRRAAVAEARAELRKAEKLLEPVLAPDADDLLAVRFLIARSLVWAQQQTLALSMIESAEKLAGPQRIQALTDLGSLATRARLEWMLDGGQAQAAVPLAKRLIEQADALFPSESPRRLDARQRLAETYILGDQADEASAVFRTLAQPPFNAPSMEAEFKARAFARKVEKLVASHRYEEAEPLAQEWREMFIHADPPNPFYLSFAELFLGDCLYAQGRFEQALQKFKLTLPLFADSVGPEHVYITTSQYHIGLAAHALGHHRAALALFEAVDRWYLKHVSARGSPSAMFARARVLADMGEPADALVALDRIDKSLLPMFVQSPGLEAWVSAERGRMLMALGRGAEGRPLLQSSVPAMAAAGMPKWQVARYQKLMR